MSRRGHGRSEENEQFWRDVFRRHGKSGRNVREFCRGEGLKESAFYFSKRTIAERDREKKSLKTNRAKKRRPRKASVRSASTFMPLAVVGETPRVEIVAPDGWQVRVPDGVNESSLQSIEARNAHDSTILAAAYAPNRAASHGHLPQALHGRVKLGRPSGNLR